MKTFKNIRDFIHELDLAQANYAYGYIKGYHSISDDTKKQNGK